MDMSKYKGMFISETKEHLQSMNQLIISLEKEPTDQPNIEALFREAHSIKGMSASMGYHDIAELSHKMEDMMDLFRKGEIILDSDAVDLLFEGLDLLEMMLKGIEDDQPADVDCSSLLQRMSALKGGEAKEPLAEPPPFDTSPAGETKKEEKKETEAATEAEATKAGDLKKWAVEVSIDNSSQIPGMRAYLVFKTLKDLGNVTSVSPDIEAVKKGNFDNKLFLNLSTKREAKEIEILLGKMVELAGFTVAPCLEEDSPSSMERAEEAKADHTKRAAPQVGKSHQVRTVRVTTDLLDNLINIVGEMIIARSRLFDAGKEIKIPSLQDSMVQMSGLIRDLHGQVMTVRMTPIENLMERLPRVVRDLARKSAKEVDLRIEGKDIELDRAIVDELGDPLVHILRNCVDHGIEPAAEREKVGKDPKGSVRIRAMRERDQVLINIEDDGRGMDVAKIKKKAIERGVITKERAQLMTDREAFMLVCYSGLSTAEKVTDVSGRGVGMDAAKNVVDSIGGSLEIESSLGRGTVITLKLPLTVAIVHVLLVRLGSQPLAVPISKIIQTLEVEKANLKRSQKQLAVLVDNELIPLLSLRKILNVKSKEKASSQVSVVVLEVKGKKVGLVVDAFVGQQEAFVKPLLPPLAWVKGFSGATILGDGSVIFVLDITNLM